MLLQTQQYGSCEKENEMYWSCMEQQLCNASTYIILESFKKIKKVTYDSINIIIKSSIRSVKIKVEVFPGIEKWLKISVPLVIRMLATWV